MDKQLLDQHKILHSQKLLPKLAAAVSDKPKDSRVGRIRPKERRLFIEVTVRDMHPGLTSEDALIGTRHMNSAVKSVRVLCVPMIDDASVHEFPGMLLQMPDDRIVQDARVLILSLHGATAKDTAMHIHSAGVRQENIFPRIC
jgi:hypothetical protein